MEIDNWQIHLKWTSLFSIYTFNVNHVRVEWITLSGTKTNLVIHFFNATGYSNVNFFASLMVSPFIRCLQSH